MLLETNMLKGSVPLSKTNLPLADAEQEAQALSDSIAVGAVAQPCSSMDEKKVIEIKVVGEDGAGLDGINLRIIRGDMQILTGKTGPTGLYRFRGIEPGSYQLSFPELDQDAWLLNDIQPLPEADANCTSTASWLIVPAKESAMEKIHVIKQGECVGKIAEDYGFFRNTIWEYSANADLRKLRHDNMHILLAKDIVVIPPMRQKTVAATTGDQLTVLRLGVPERLRIRFLHFDESPKAGVLYMLSITTDKSIPVVDISGKTDENGFVDQYIPPSALIATITLNPGLRPEIYKFNIGYTNPIDEVSGWQARLNNLGYDCGVEDNDLGPKTQNAIFAFQRDKRLEETGEMDEATKIALLEMALS